MRRCSKPLAVAIVLGLLSLASPARANYSISIGSLSLAPGGSGTLNVNIASTNPSGDNLDTFGFQLQITPSSPRVLEFASTQPNPYSNSSYVFFGDSLTQPFSLGSVSGPNNTIYIGGDSTLSGNPVHIGMTNELLLQLAVVPGPGTLAPDAGDTFTISLIPNANTSFSVGGTDIPFTSTPGTVTITSAVPEPAKVVMLGVGGMFVAMSWLVSRLRAGRTASAHA